MLSNFYYFYPPFLGSGANLTKFSNEIAKAYSTYLYDEKFFELSWNRVKKNNF